MAHVEVDERSGRRIVCGVPITRNQLVRHSRRLEPDALEREEGDLLRGIEPAQPGVELQAINHTSPPRRSAEKYVLRTQIAMPVEKSYAAPGKGPRRASEEIELRSGYLHDSTVADAELGCAELLFIAPYRASQPRAVSPVGHRPTLGPPKEELAQSCREALEVPCTQAARGKCRIEHAPSRKPAHLDQPVGDDHALPQGQRSGAVTSERNNAAVDLACETAIEPQLFPTDVFSMREGVIIQGRLPQRLLELVGPSARQEHPCEVRLYDLDAAGSVWIVARIGEEADLLTGCRIRSTGCREHAPPPLTSTEASFVPPR